VKQPYILVVDDDHQVLRAIRRDVQNRYRKDYRVVATESAPEALELVGELKRKGESLALIVSDQRMPEMEGTEFLEKAKAVFPEVRTVLLTAYSDIEAAIKAINDIRLDYYLLKPWSPPEEKLYPVLDELLDDWQASYRPSREGMRVVGYQWSAASHAVKQFLSGNLVPYAWIDIDTDPEAEALLAGSGTGRESLPLVVLPDGTVLPNPALPELAARAGLRQKASADLYDVVIVGAGPAGLAAAVYGASEG
jgi:thioredoxin reductase (NADPH)